jgi:8-oxo-dGTP pyrophosphatase MutT (NUDIX family)
MDWHPRATVAAVVEREGRFLMVEERIDGRVVLNQPAGHLEEGESILQAVTREVLEETAWHFRASGLVGIYRWQIPPAGDTFLRFCFVGQVADHVPERGLDEGILGTRWLGRGELEARRSSLRSPLVLRCIDDYLAGLSFPLEILREVL